MESQPQTAEECMAILQEAEVPLDKNSVEAPMGASERAEISRKLWLVKVAIDKIEEGQAEVLRKYDEVEAKLKHAEHIADIVTKRQSLEEAAADVEAMEDSQEKTEALARVGKLQEELEKLEAIALGGGEQGFLTKMKKKIPFGMF